METWLGVIIPTVLLNGSTTHALICMMLPKASGIVHNVEKKLLSERNESKIK